MKLLRKYIRQILNEISSDALSNIEDVVYKIKSDQLPFENIFQGKKRILKPFYVSDPMLEKLQDFIVDAGLTLNLGAGVVKRIIEKEYQGKKRKTVKKQKVGKFFQRIISKSGDSEEVELAKMLQKFWVNKSKFYRENPEATGKVSTKYAIIYTRHPIDVLRMSDFAEVESCHSPGSSYFKCAIAEMADGGAISYVVSIKDLLEELGEDNFDDINLEEYDDDEIFLDKERDVGGVEPLARVRLRRFVHTKTGAELAVPERRNYGSVPVVSNVISFVHANQKDAEAKVFGDQSEIDLSDFKMTGGTYGDTSSSQLFGNLYPNYKFTGEARISRDTEDQIGNAGGATADDYEEQCEEITRAANNRLNYCNINYSIEDEEDQPYIYTHGSMTIPSSLLSTNEDDFDDFDEDDVEELLVKNNLEGFFDFHNGGEIFLGDDYVTISLNMEYFAPGDSAICADPEEYESMAGDVENFDDDEVDDVIKVIKKYVLSLNINDEIKEFLEKIDRQEFDLSDFWSIENNYPTIIFKSDRFLVPYDSFNVMIVSQDIKLRSTPGTLSGDYYDIYIKGKKEGEIIYDRTQTYTDYSNKDGKKIREKFYKVYLDNTVNFVTFNRQLTVNDNEDFSKKFTSHIIPPLLNFVNDRSKKLPKGFETAIQKRAGRFLSKELKFPVTNVDLNSWGDKKGRGIMFEITFEADVEHFEEIEKALKNNTLQRITEERIASIITNYFNVDKNQQTLKLEAIFRQFIRESFL